jgi:glycosyltransferase involved in cell wall biosynthesis
MLNVIPVTVIIPCYRCSSSIGRAIKSISSQTYRPKEVILIDDYSDDEGKNLSELYKLKKLYNDIEINIISLNKNMGPAGARNAGWNQAKQPYIAFLDADDAWHPEKLAIQYGWMVRRPEVLLTAHNTKLLKSPLIDSKLSKNVDFDKVNILKLLFVNYFPTRSVMLKRDIDYRFFPGKRYAEDYLLWLSIALDKNLVYYLNLPLAFSFKNDFGDSGLTADLYKCHLGLTDTYRQLLERNKIPKIVFFGVMTFEYVKYIRRYLIVIFRKLIQSINDIF